MFIYSIENKCLCTDLINLNINVTVLYVPNIYAKGFENNIIFLGTANGDLFIFDLNDFKFLQLNFNFKSIKNYLSNNKIKIKTLLQTDTIIGVRLDQTDYSRIFLVYSNFGLFVLNLQVCIFILI